MPYTLASLHVHVSILFMLLYIGNFSENCIFANSVKRHTLQVKYSRIWHELPSSVKDIFSPFREGFNFAEVSGK